MRPPTAPRLRASSSAERSARSSPRASPTWSGRRARRSRCRPSWRSSRETRSCSTGSPSARPAGQGMSNAEIQRLFAPRPATVAAVRSYLSANGLSVVDSTDMSLVVSGTAAAADQAFGVGLQDVHGARGLDVSGARRERPAAQGDRLGRAVGGGARYVAQAALASPDPKHARGQPRASPDSCRTTSPGSRANTRPGPTGGYLPADLAGYYGHDADANHDGTGQMIGFVEFSNYNRQDCERLQAVLHRADDHRHAHGDRQGESAARRTRRPGRGQPRHRGRDGRRPRRQPDQVYKADNNLALLRRCSTKMRADERRRRVGQLGPVRAARARSSSRGSRTPRSSCSPLAASSFYVASGDNGSADCRRGHPARSSSRSTTRRASRSRPPCGGTNLRRRGPAEGRVEGLRRRRLVQLAAAGLPARP